MIVENNYLRVTIITDTNQPEGSGVYVLSEMRKADQ